nr:hypothetical protein [uncultured Chryseobacterium sp.]
MLNEIELKKMLEICNNATPSPWTSYIEGRNCTSGSSFIMTGTGENRDYDIEFVTIKPEDQNFIAMARNSMPQLIEELLRLKFNKE